LDKILGPTKNKDCYDSSGISLATRIVKVEKQMDDIDLKFDKFIDQYNGDMSMLLNSLNSVLNPNSLGTTRQASMQNMSNFNLNVDTQPSINTANGSNYNLTGSRRILSFTVGSEPKTGRDNVYESDNVYSDNSALIGELDDKSSEELTLPFENELQLNEDSKINTSCSSVDSKKVSFNTSSSQFIIETEDSANLSKSEDILKQSSIENLTGGQFHSDNVNETSEIVTKKSGLARMRSFN